MIFSRIGYTGVGAVLLILLFRFTGYCQTNTSPEITRMRTRAQNVTIIRDQWGVPHIYGKTDADAVFGALYSQCEENFIGVERNYLNVLGRTAEVDGEVSLFTDVLLQLVEDSTEAKLDYNRCSPDFRILLDAYADGINYYLYKHPEVKPRVLRHFKPWYALMFTDGSVGSTMTGGINVEEVKNFYTRGSTKSEILKGPVEELLETGSNGFAISPGKSLSGKALLYINPHVPFYFRSELEMNSDQGLQVYGAVTWGQFFVYQGFNAHCGWMHTSSNADVADLYEEKIVKKGGKLFYTYDGKLNPVKEKFLVLYYKTDQGLRKKELKAYFTGHGPILAVRKGKWISLKAKNRSLDALVESWQITKARNFEGYKKAMGLLANNSNNTVYADDQGNIAFWYGNFMPKRDARMDWTLPVDGTISSTEWKGVHSLNETVHVYNPATGFIQNCNATPFESSGISSPQKSDYPDYMAPAGQNFRGVNAIRLLNNSEKLNLDSLIKIGYDHYLTAFDQLLPALFSAFDQGDTNFKSLNRPIQILRSWNRQSSVSSVGTTLAISWASSLLQDQLPKPKTDEEGTYFTRRVENWLSGIDKKVLLDYLLQTIKRLDQDYGNWEIPWGNINRYQRLGEGKTFDDNLPSLPSGLASATFGALPSFQSRTFQTHNRYGYSGNSFIAAVEFGDSVRAKSLITGGQSFDPQSAHFSDQAQMFLDGKFKQVLFYKKDVLKHAEKIYHPGE